MTGLAERQQLLDELVRLTEADMSALWRQFATSATDREFAAIIAEAFPELIGQYSAVAAELGAQWYAESAPDLPYQPQSFLPAAEGLPSSVSWALGAPGDAALSRLSGVAQRQIWTANRDTIIGNARAEGAGSTWARVARAGACAFCAMLATRKAVYSSKATATPKSKYHDHCHCQAKEVRPGQSYDPPDYVQRFEDAYRQATREVPGVGQHGAIDTAGVLAHMRGSLGTH